MSIVTERELESAYSAVSKLMDRMSRESTIYDFDRAWIALLVNEQCIYKSHVVIFKYGVQHYVRLWEDLARGVLRSLGMTAEGRSALDVELRVRIFGEDIVLSLRNVINMLLMRYFSEHSDVAKMFVEPIASKLKSLSQDHHKVLSVLLESRDLMRFGFLKFIDSWLGDLVRDKVKERYGEEMTDSQIERVVNDLVRTGLLMVCSTVTRDFKRMTMSACIEYYVPPHVYPLWIKLGEHLGI